jgi:hypothetical protein
VREAAARGRKRGCVPHAVPPSRSMDDARRAAACHISWATTHPRTAFVEQGGNLGPCASPPNLGQATLGQLAQNWVLSYIGNLAGSLMMVRAGV